MLTAVFIGALALNAAVAWASGSRGLQKLSLLLLASYFTCEAYMYAAIPMAHLTGINFADRPIRMVAFALNDLAFFILCVYVIHANRIMVRARFWFKFTYIGMLSAHAGIIIGTGELYRYDIVLNALCMVQVIMCTASGVSDVVGLILRGNRDHLFGYSRMRLSENHK